MSTNPNEPQPSTLQSAFNQAAGAVQSAVGSLTGNPVDKQEAAHKKTAAEDSHTLSHTAAKVGPVSATPSGGVATDDPDRTSGRWNQTVGAGKEAVGGLLGADGLKREGERQNAEGKGQEARGQMADLGRGVKDRVGGTLGEAVGTLTGGEREKEEARQRREEGRARVRGVEADLDTEAEK